MKKTNKTQVKESVSAGRRVTVICGVLLAGGIGAHAADYGDGDIDNGGQEEADYPSIGSGTVTVNGFDTRDITWNMENEEESDGGTVKLRTGSYDVTGRINALKKVKLTGNNWNRSKLNRNSSFTGSIIQDQGSDLTDAEFSRFLLDGKGGDGSSTQGANGIETDNDHDRLRLDQIRIRRFSNGILGGFGDHVRIENCLIHDNGSNDLFHNIYCRRTGHLLIEDTVARHANHGDGVKLWGHLDEGTNFGEHIIVQDDSELRDNAKTGIAFLGNERILVQDSEMTDNDGGDTDNAAGIFLGDHDGKWNRWIDVINNDLRDNNMFGIRGKYCRNMWVEGNLSTGNGSESNGGNYSFSNCRSWRSDDNTSS